MVGRPDTFEELTPYNADWILNVKRNGILSCRRQEKI